MRHIALVILRDAEGKFLLQFRDSGAPTGKLRFTLFGGSIDEGETPEAGALRETLEELELAVRPEDLRLVTVKPFFQEELMQDETLNIFEVTKPVSWDDIRIREGAGAAFLTKEEALSMDSINKILRMILEECF